MNCSINLFSVVINLNIPPQKVILQKTVFSVDAVVLGDGEIRGGRLLLDVPAGGDEGVQIETVLSANGLAAVGAAEGIPRSFLLVYAVDGGRQRGGDAGGGGWAWS